MVHNQTLKEKENKNIKGASVACHPTVAAQICVVSEKAPAKTPRRLAATTTRSPANVKEGVQCHFRDAQNYRTVR
jgi:hypothetical protein